MKKLFFLIIFLSSCTVQSNNDVSTQKFNFSKDMKFEDFKTQLKNYAKNSSYPYLDE